MPQLQAHAAALGRILLVGASVLLLLPGLPAQTTRRPQREEKPAPATPEKQKAEEPKPEKEKPEESKPQEPKSETDAAAELLRKMLGLDEGPGDEKSIPKGPPKLPPKPAPKAPPQKKADPVKTAPKQPTEQEKQQMRDATRAAADMLKRLLGLEEGPGEEEAIPKGPPKLPITPESGEAGKSAEESAPVPGPSAEEEAPIASAPPAHTPDLVRGSLAMRYRARKASEDEDQDLVGLLNVSFGDAQRHGVTGHLSARGYLDIDDVEFDDLFRGLDNANGDDYDLRLYEAYVDVHEVPLLSTVRAGRQEIYETPVPVSFDGVQLRSDPFGRERLWFGAHGGVPVHHYESSPGGDEFWGAAIGARPWDGGRVRLDWMHLRDRRDETTAENEYYGVAWWHRFDDFVRVHGRHSWVDGREQDLVLRLDANVPDAAFDFAIDYRQLLRTQRAQSNELDPYFAILQEYHPYRQLGVSGTWLAHPRFDVAAGFDVRRLADSRDEGMFNREYERGHLTPAFRDAFTDGLDISLIGEWWSSDGEDTMTFGADFDWELSPKSTLRFGSSYRQFEYDSMTGRENERVRDYYIRFQHRPEEALRFHFGYAFERNDFDRFHTFRVGFTWQF